MTHFLRRVLDLIRGSLNGLIERAEDPEKMLEQRMRDMQSSFDRSRIEVAQVLAQKHRIEVQLQKAEKDMEEWERRAILALKSGDDALARKALERKRSFAEIAQGFRTQLQEQVSAA